MDRRLPEVAFGQLPPLLRVLYVGAPRDAWLKACLADNSDVAVKIDAEHVDSAMVRLRLENYDCVILDHDPGSQDAIAIIGLIRTVVPQQAIVVTGQQPAERWTAQCLEASADAYVCRPSTDGGTLIWVIARAVERQRMAGELRSLAENLQSQRSQHHQAALHQLRAQRSLLLEHLDGKVQDPHPPTWLVQHFVELLRIYVVSGVGNPKTEVRHLVTQLKSSEVTLAEALMAHTVATEKLVLGLGNRPTWHVLGRANLMAYELVMQMKPMNRHEVSRCSVGI